MKLRRKEGKRKEETRKEKVSKSKSWFSEEVNKNDLPLVKFIKEKRGSTQLKQKWKRSNNKHQRNTKNYKRLQWKKLYVKKLDILEEIDKFLEKYSPLKLNQDEIENVKRLLTSNKIGSLIKRFPTSQSLGPGGKFTGKFH